MTTSEDLIESAKVAVQVLALAEEIRQMFMERAEGEGLNPRQAAKLLRDMQYEHDLANKLELEAV